VKASKIRKGPLLLSNKFITPSVMMKRDLPFRFFPGKSHMEDYLLWLQIVWSGLLVVRLHVELAYIHKEMFGERGLSSEIWNMERGELSAYKHLYRDGQIPLLATLGLFAYSALKCCKRVVQLAFRSRSGRRGLSPRGKDSYARVRKIHNRQSASLAAPPRKKA
jgi:hypothetical protein